MYIYNIYVNIGKIRHSDSVENSNWIFFCSLKNFNIHSIIDFDLGKWLWRRYNCQFNDTSAY